MSRPELLLVAEAPERNGSKPKRRLRPPPTRPCKAAESPCVEALTEPALTEPALTEPALTEPVLAQTTPASIGVEQDDDLPSAPTTVVVHGLPDLMSFGEDDEDDQDDETEITLAPVTEATIMSFRSRFSGRAAAVKDHLAD